MSQNFFAMKNDELKKLAADYKVEFDEKDFKRKEVIRQLQEITGQSDTKSDRQLYRIKLHNTDGEAGSDAVFVGVNGKGWNIPREKEVDVPAYVVEALNNAVIVEFVPDQKGGPHRERTRPRFPMTNYGLIHNNTGE